MDVEQASASVDALIERRSKGGEEANALAAMWRASERQHAEQQRRENREAWCAFHEHLRDLHSALAADHEEKARRLLVEA